MAHLESVGRADDTLVVFTSDHGEMGGSHGLYAKQTEWDEANRVPLMFYWPGWIRPQKIHWPINHADLVPTILGVCKLDPLPDAQGRDFSANLRTGTGATGTSAYVQGMTVPGPPSGGSAPAPNGTFEWRTLRTVNRAN